MQQLSNNCTLSKITVKPENWQNPKANLNLAWEISFRFTDNNLNKTIQKRIVVPKKYHSYQDRKLYVEKALKGIVEKIVEQGFNPITKQYSKDCAEMPINDEDHTLRTALEYAFKLLKSTPEYRINVKGAIKYFLIAASMLSLDNQPIKSLSRKHMKRILEKCGTLKVERNKKIVPISWTNERYNYYRAMLASLFEILNSDEIIEHNIMKDVPKLKETERIRKRFSPGERAVLTNNQDKLPYEFWRYINIFFHSGCRSAELFRLKKEDVYIHSQEFKILIKKGNHPREKIKAINDDVYPYWKEIFAEAADKQYIFSKGLKPGDMPISPKQITIRWRKHVKQKLGVDVDFYSLKHSNLDEIAAKFDIETAKDIAAHTTPVITIGSYATGEQQRQLNRLKKISNKL